MGDVYLYAGQSNMEFPNRYATNGAGLAASTDAGRLRKVGGFEDALATLADAARDPANAEVRFEKSLRAWWMGHY